MKKALLPFMALFLIHSAYSQKTLLFNSINAKLGAPVAVSQSTFRTFWCPRLDVDISASRPFNNKFSYGINLNYSLFQCRWIHQLKSSLHMINPNIIAVYDFLHFNKFQVSPEFSLGYSWLFLTNPETPSTYLKKYSESGLSIRPGINLSYAFRRFSMGFSGSYKIIFTKYGVNGVDLYDRKKEADFISYISAGLFIHISLKNQK